jgi:hypothetical protein
LFAVLAGFAVALITGRRTPKTGLAGRQAVAKVIIRAVILIALGTALTSLHGRGLRGAGVVGLRCHVPP